MTMNELTCIHAAQHGDLEAFNQLVLSYQDLAYWRAYSIMENEELASDALQDSFIKAYRRLRNFRGGSFRAWLLRIVTNTCYDELRRLKRQPTLSLFSSHLNDDEEDERPYPGIHISRSVEEIVEQTELSASLRHHLEVMPEDQRAAVVMIDVLGAEYLEAADILAVPLGTLKSRLARGRIYLRQRLNALPEFHPHGARQPWLDHQDFAYQ
jgi:RNA polymerase sigma-70 factor (ECF subfamily)